MDHLVDLSVQGVGVASQFAPQPCEVDLETGQYLAQLVVDLASDPGAFLFTDRLQVCGQAPQAFARVKELQLGLAARRDVANDASVAPQITTLGTNRRDDGVGPEAAVVPA